VPLPIVKKGNLTVIENIIDDWNLEYTPAFDIYNSYYFSFFETREEIDFTGASVNLKFCFAGEITNEFTGLVLNKCHEDETTQTDSSCGNNKKTVIKTQYYNAYLIIKHFDPSVSILGLLLDLTNFINCKYFKVQDSIPIIDMDCPNDYSYDKFKFAYRVRILVVLEVKQIIHYIKNRINKVIVFPRITIFLQGCSGCIDSSYNDDYGNYICDIFKSTFVTRDSQDNIVPNRWLNLRILSIRGEDSIYTGPRGTALYAYIDRLVSEINSENSFYLVFNKFPGWIWSSRLQWFLTWCLTWRYSFDYVEYGKYYYCSPPLVSEGVRNSGSFTLMTDLALNTSIIVEIYK
jgi:hypothetical protein